MTLAVKRAVLFFLIAILFSPFVAHAYSNPGAPIGFVNDFANVLAVDQKAALEAKLKSFSDTTSNEIAIAIVNTLGGDTIENFAVKLFEDWKIGKDKKDNGVLLLVAMEEREVRIEVGYGLEGALTDGISSSIIRNTIVPNFKIGDYYAGIDQGADRIIEATKGEYVADEEGDSDFISGILAVLFNAPLPFLFFGFLLLEFLMFVFGSSKSWWHGGVAGLILGLLFLAAGGLSIFGVLWLSGIGLGIDFLCSRYHPRFIEWKKKWRSGRGGPGGGIWFGGGSVGSSSSGGFGGFGGGSSGGGGASGRW